MKTDYSEKPRFTHSIFLDLLLYMMGFGLFIGVLFPPLTSLVTHLDQKEIYTYSFFITCMFAGFLVGILNYLLVKLILGNKFRQFLDKMVQIRNRINSDNSMGICDEKECLIHIKSDDEIGASADNFNQLVLSLYKRIRLEDRLLEINNFVHHYLETRKLSHYVLEELCKQGNFHGGICLIQNSQEDKWEGISHYGLRESDLDKEYLFHPGSIVDRVLANRKTLTLELPEDIPVELKGFGLSYRPRFFIIAPVSYYSSVISFFIFVGDNKPDEEISRLMELIFSQLGHAMQNSLLHEKLRKISIIDELTQVYNRRYGFEKLQEAFQNSVQKNTPITVVLCDLDFFKKINDTYGHLAGDYILREMCLIYQSNIRKEDILCRYGGEEFMLILLEASGPDGFKHCERFRKKIENHEFHWEGNSLNVTMSFGVSCYPDCFARSEYELIQQADDALYQAKQNGRNQVVLASEPIK
ncbi:MAG: GGDEF domain-containing protein [Leptospiraceae bacterium]|nr:GGDEF domain-containing protein [Leptospiraceae bacterium]MCP5503417.1 GGDEF domain-containing protein [Leptospiraceae bacterium]